MNPLLETLTVEQLPIAITIASLFSVGEFAYIKADAYKGFVNQICIKKVIIQETIVQLPQTPPLFVLQKALVPVGMVYQDTLNEMWLENELTDHDTATALVIQYQNLYLSLC